MSNALIAFGNLVDAASLSGGSWRATLPLTNLQNRVLGKVARSSDAALASTKLNIDVGADNPVRVISLAGHNFSLDARYRITAGTTDTGWLDVWPAVYDSDDLSWQAVNWWSCQYTAGEIAGFNWNLIHIFDSEVTEQNWLIEIDDTTNSAGYIEFGRLFMGKAWQTTVNMSYGAAIGWEDPSGIQSALSGAEFFDERTRYRVAKFSTDWMSEDEGLSSAFDVQQQVGVTREVVFIWNPDDTIHSLRRQFLGRLRQLSPIEFPLPSLTRTAWEVKELI